MILLVEFLSDGCDLAALEVCELDGRQRSAARVMAPNMSLSTGRSRALDERVPHASNVAPLAAALAAPSEAHLVAGAGHFAFRPPCDPALEEANPAVWQLACVDAADFGRAAFQTRFERMVIEFLVTNLSE